MADHNSPNEKPPPLPRMLLLEGLAGAPKMGDVPDASALMARVRDFLPQMAAANQALSSDNCSSSGIQIVNVHHDDSLPSDNDSSHHDQRVSEGQVEIDVSVYKEDGSEASASDSESSNDSEGEDKLPEAFREETDVKGDSKAKHTTRTKKLIEEVVQHCEFSPSASDQQHHS